MAKSIKVKSLINKTVELKENVKTTYAYFIKTLINLPKDGGYSIADIKERVDLLSVIDSNKTEESISLTEAQIVLLKSLLPEKWGIMSIEIPIFVDAVNAL